MVSTTSSPSLKVIGPPLPPPQSSPPCVVALEAQLSSLREQYRKLQCDFNCKVQHKNKIHLLIIHTFLTWMILIIAKNKNKYR